MKKILTISIAAYNAEKDLEHCLESLINTGVADLLEIIVVNDGSKDRTSDIAKCYQRKYPEIVKVIDKENGGHGSTINTSIKIASGKYFKTVDSDDWVNGAELEKLVNWLKDNDVDLVLTPYDIIDANNKNKKTQVKPFQKEQKLNKVLNVGQADAITVYMHAATFHTPILKRMGPIIDEKCFYVDLEYTIFPLVYIQTFACLDYSVYQYLLGTVTQSMNINNMIKRRQEHLRVIKKLVEYYIKHEKEYVVSLKKIALERIRSSILTQYKIYANMEPKEALLEIKTFDGWLSAEPEIYIGPEGRYMKIIRFHRKTKFKFYIIITKLLKMMSLEPTL